MGKLNKQILRQYAEFECERQLFLNMAEGDPNWIQPLRPVLPRSENRPKPEVFSELGKRYEQHIYQRLLPLPGVQVNRGPRNQIATTTLHYAMMEKLYHSLSQTTAIPITEYHSPATPTTTTTSPGYCLLEHQWQTSPSFIHHIFGIDATGTDPTSPIQEYSGVQRPDILLLSRNSPTEALSGKRELLPSGKLRELTREDHQQRFGIAIVDIKHTSEHNIGKRQFIELLFYAHALSAWLYEQRLADRFYVRVEGHGILPHIDEMEFHPQDIASLYRWIVPFDWDDTIQIFAHIVETLRELWHNTPCPVETTSVNIQAACGRCDYLEDCKNSLGLDPDGHNHPGDWDVRLLPYTSRSIAEQLHAQGFCRICQVADHIANYPMGDTPEPIYPELPMLALKARALLNRQPTCLGATDPGRHLSLALPRYSDIALTFDLEADPTNEVVFGIGFFLQMSVSPNAPYAAIFHQWWQAWREQKKQYATPAQVDLTAIRSVLSADFLSWWLGQEQRNESQLDWLLKEFAITLWELLDDEFADEDERFQIAFPGDELDGFTVKEQLIVRYRYTYINAGVELEQEQKLAANVVCQLHRILGICNTVETLCRVAETDAMGKTRTKGPSFALFYWSTEQLQHIQDMLERHLPYLANHEKIQSRFAELIGWLTPSDSEVRHFHQHKKLYDLRTFLETSMGLPHVINYAWDDIAVGDNTIRVDRHYWPMHFNYMDFSAWHHYIQEEDTNKQAKRQQKMRQELRRKLYWLHRIRTEYQSKSRALLSAQSYAVESQKVRQRQRHPLHHPLARYWYLYSRLNGAISELHADHFRTTYPAYSIGKLAAAEVSNLLFAPEPENSKKGKFIFQLRGLSANMKIDEGSYVLLIPEPWRDLGYYQQQDCTVILSSLQWNAHEHCYDVSATPYGTTANHPYFLLDEEGESTTSRSSEAIWYLYPTAHDPWSAKLGDNKDCYLQRRNFGTSWLGHRLAYLWEVGAEPVLPQPQEIDFTLPEVYVYAPQILPQHDFDAAAPLLTKAYPPPDASQREAIQMALASTICCIQGPPGTGKSQTIAALLDEFILRVNRPVRILVTAFSYAAIHVALDKVLNSRQANGEKTTAATMKRILLHSGEYAPIAGVTDLTYADGLRIDNIRIDFRKKPYHGKKLDELLGESFILFANAHQLYKFSTRNGTIFKQLKADFAFDLIVVDEASQLPADYFLASADLIRPQKVSLCYPKDEPQQWPAPADQITKQQIQQMALSAPLTLEKDSLTQVVIVGDHNQLPPVQPVKPPRKLQIILDSLFTYYVEGHQVRTQQLRVNYRSEPQIVEYTQRLGLYQTLEAYRATHPYPPLPPPPASITEGWLRQILDPAHVVGALIHTNEFETAVSALEAELTARIVTSFFLQMQITGATAEQDFWEEGVGIVSPHNAQGRLITRRIFEYMQPLTTLPPQQLMALLTRTIYSVEKFQGSDRTFIIASVGISSKDQLAAEEEFIYNLNRLNVLTSRARQKLLLICSQNYLDYLPRQREFMEYAAKVRDYAGRFCNQSTPLIVSNQHQQEQEVLYRWHQPS